MNTKQIEANNPFLKLVENSYSGLLMFDAELQLIYYSDAAQNIIGFKAALRQGTPVAKLICQEDWPAVRRAIDQVMINPVISQTCTFRTVLINNYEATWLEAIFSNLLNEPDLQAIVCTLRDITEQRKTRTDLYKRTEQVTGVLETMADGFISLDENLCYTYVNKQVADLLGRKAESLVGRHIWTMFPEAVGSATWLAVETALKEKKEVCLEDYSTQLNLWLENRAYPSGGGVSMFIRDITRRKLSDLEQSILAEVSRIFQGTDCLCDLLNKLLRSLVCYGSFKLAEIWLTEGDKERIYLEAYLADNDEMKDFYLECRHIKSFLKGQGLPGKTWELQKVLHWQKLEESDGFLRPDAAKKASIKSAYGIPLVAGDLTIGVLLLGMTYERPVDKPLMDLFGKFGAHFGAEIKRKQLEGELEQVFLFAPDILCMANTDGYLKKINKAMCDLLERSENELLSTPFIELVHPFDRDITAEKFKNISLGQSIAYFENRYLTKAGKIKWLAWTTTGASEKGVFYCSAKDVTEQKELEVLLKKANALARIGSWEIEVEKRSLYWSPITKFLHGVPEDYEPQIETALNFYKEEPDRKLVNDRIMDAIINGTCFDFVLPIITATNQEKWVRVVGEPEFSGSKCIRVYGSFQDVDSRVKAEQQAKAALEERDVILESIGDAFFAVDRNWVVTYWNKTAEKVLRRKKSEMMGCAFWDAFPDIKATVSYQYYQQALETGQPVHFENYYAPIKNWYDVSIYPSVNGLSVYVKDITSRKLSELLLLESESNYSELFNLSPQPMWVADLETLQFLDVNQSTIAHYGYSRQEFLSMSLKDIRPPDEVKNFEQSVAENRLNPDLQRRKVLVHRNKAGELRQVEIQVAPIRYMGKQASLVIATDITERLMAEARLRDSEKRYSDLFQLSPLPKWVFDLDTLFFLDVNEAAIAVYGYTREEFLSMQIPSLRPSAELPKMKAALEEAHNQNIAVYKGIFTHQKKNGELIEMEVQSTLIKYQGKNARVVVANDITERLNYVKAIEAQNEKLKEISWMQSHVIRAPLARILGLVPLIANQQETPGSIRQMLEYLQISASELDEVITDITNKTAVEEYRRRYLR